MGACSLYVHNFQQPLINLAHLVRFIGTSQWESNKYLGPYSFLFQCNVIINYQLYKQWERNYFKSSVLGDRCNFTSIKRGRGGSEICLVICLLNICYRGCTQRDGQSSQKADCYFALSSADVLVYRIHDSGEWNVSLNCLCVYLKMVTPQLPKWTPSSIQPISVFCPLLVLKAHQLRHTVCQNNNVKVITQNLYVH